MKQLRNILIDIGLGVLAALLLFVILGYSGLGVYLIHKIMALTGEDFYEGETWVAYSNKYLSGLLLFLFVLSFTAVRWIRNRFRK
jgi:hypothetical protein